MVWYDRKDEKSLTSACIITGFCNDAAGQEITRRCFCWGHGPDHELDDEVARRVEVLTAAHASRTPSDR